MLSPLGRVPRRRPPVRRRSRRAIPAVLLLLVLFVLAAAVWWRVLHRGSGTSTTAGAPCPPGTIASALTLNPHRVQVRVYNATDRSGLAGTVASQLAGLGYVIAARGNDPLANSRQVAGVGELRYGPNGAAQALLASLEIPGVKLAQDPRTDSVVDIALGPGFQKLATRADYARGRRQLAGQASASPAATC